MISVNKVNTDLAQSIDVANESVRTLQSDLAAMRHKQQTEAMPFTLAACITLTLALFEDTNVQKLRSKIESVVSLLVFLAVCLSVCLSVCVYHNRIMV